MASVCPGLGQWGSPSIAAGVAEDGKKWIKGIVVGDSMIVGVGVVEAVAAVVALAVASGERHKDRTSVGKVHRLLLRERKTRVN